MNGDGPVTVASDGSFKLGHLSIRGVYKSSSQNIHSENSGNFMTMLSRLMWRFGQPLNESVSSWIRRGINRKGGIMYS